MHEVGRVRLNLIGGIVVMGLPVLVFPGCSARHDLADPVESERASASILFVAVRSEIPDWSESPVPRRGLRVSSTKISRRQWRSIMGTEPWKFRDRTNARQLDEGDDNEAAATRISWLDADLFCRKLSMQRGTICRLPSVLEWEIIEKQQTARSKLAPSRVDVVVGLRQGPSELCVPEDRTCEDVREGLVLVAVRGGAEPNKKSSNEDIYAYDRSLSIGFRIVEETLNPPMKVVSRRARIIRKDAPRGPQEVPESKD